MSEKVRENRLRGVAEGRGLRLEKSRRRDPRAIDFGGYMLIDNHMNSVVSGANPYAYSLSLDDVEKDLSEDWCCGKFSDPAPSTSAEASQP